MELLHVLRAMGQNPSEAELNTIIMEIDIDGSGTIDFMEFVNLAREKLNVVDIENDIRKNCLTAKLGSQLMFLFTGTHFGCLIATWTATLTCRS